MQKEQRFKLCVEGMIQCCERLTKIFLFFLKKEAVYAILALNGDLWNNMSTQRRLY